MVQAKLLLLLVAHLLMTGLPAVAVAVVLVRKHMTSIPVLLAAALAASGAIAMLGFWLYYADPTVGKVYSYLVLVASVSALVVSLRDDRIDRAVIRQLAVPFALWGLGSIFLVFLGFMHGGTGNALPTAAIRFTNYFLPSDNDIPRFYAAWFYAHGHTGRPPVYPAGWLFSDRPPLQVGYVLMQLPFGSDSHGLNYELIGVVLQQLWVVGLWALLVAAGVGRVTRALAVLAVLLSNLAIVNGFYVWPKMLPAAMLLAAAALVMTPAWAEVKRSPRAAVVVAALLGLAMLAHGSSIFGIIPLAVLAVVRGVPTWRWLATAVATGLVLYVPWSLYQTHGDPPGNRLTKWMLAGKVQADDRSLSADITAAYSSVGIGGTLHDKAENFVTMAGGGPMVSSLKTAMTDAEGGHLTAALGLVRPVLFFDLLPSFGLLLVAPLLMLIARWRRVIRSAEWTFALRCYAALVIGAIVWGLLLFGNRPSQAIIHSGSYLLPILGFCAAVSGLRATFPRLAVYLVAINALISLAIFVPAVLPPPDTSYYPLAIFVAAAGLVAFAFVVLRKDTPPRPDHGATRAEVAVGPGVA